MGICGILIYLYKCAGINDDTCVRLKEPTIITPPPRPRWFKTKLSALLGLAVVECYVVYFSVNYYAHSLTGNQSKWLDGYKYNKKSHLDRLLEALEESKRVQKSTSWLKRSVNLNMEENERLRKLILRGDKIVEMNKINK